MIVRRYGSGVILSTYVSCEGKMIVLRRKQARSFTTYLGKVVELYQVPDFSYHIFRLEVQAVEASEDAMDDTSRADLVRWCSGSESEESGSCENNRLDTDHDD
jgi:hypothetical protein